METMRIEMNDLQNASEKLGKAINRYYVKLEKMEEFESFTTRCDIHTPEVVYELENLQKEVSNAKAEVVYWKLQIQKISF